MNLKDLRIAKMARKGISVEAIARKLGYSGASLEEGIKRVNEGLKRMKINQS